MPKNLRNNQEYTEKEISPIYPLQWFDNGLLLLILKFDVIIYHNMKTIENKSGFFPQIKKNF